jgi:hypothetical protein
MTLTYPNQNGPQTWRPPPVVYVSPPTAALIIGYLQIAIVVAVFAGAAVLVALGAK